MKYRLSFLIGCMAVLLGVLSLTACDDKDKKDNGIESGYSLVGTWTHSEYDPEYGLTTVTIQFNEDQTGSYTYANATETEVQNIMYTYDPTTCTGTVLIFNNHGSEESDFKIKWYDENTVTVSTYDDYSGTWESRGTFTRKTNGGGGGGTNPSGDTYSIIGTWKHVETDSYNAVATIIIEFNADNTGTFTYDYNDPYHNEYIHDVYQMRYTYNATTCTGVITRYKDSESYASTFKLVWINQNVVTVLFQDPSHPSDEWDNMGNFTREAGTNTPDTPSDTYSIIGSWKHYENGKEGPHTEIVQFNADGTGSVMVTGNEGTTIYSLSYTYSQGACAGNSVMTYKEPGGEEYYYYIDFKVKWYGPNNIVMSTKMSDDPLEDPATEWTDTAYERL